GLWRTGLSAPLLDFVSFLNDESAHGRRPLTADQMTTSDLRSPKRTLERVGGILREASLGAQPYAYKGSEPRPVGRTAITLDLKRVDGGSWIDETRAVQRFVGC